MKYAVKIVSSLFVIASCWVVAETFVVKKTRGPSLTTLKEQYATTSGELVTNCADLARNLAGVQCRLICSLYDQLNGKDSSHTTKAQLESAIKSLQEFNKQVIAFNNMAHTMKIHLKTKTA